MFLCITCAERFPIGHRFPQGRCADCYVLVTVDAVTRQLPALVLTEPVLS